MHDYHRVRFTLDADHASATPPATVLADVRHVAKLAVELAEPVDELETWWRRHAVRDADAELSYAEWVERDTDCDGHTDHERTSVHVDLWLTPELARHVVVGIYALAELGQCPAWLAEAHRSRAVVSDRSRVDWPTMPEPDLAAGQYEATMAAIGIAAGSGH